MIYTINKGSHYSGNLSVGGIHNGITTMEYSVMFDAACLIMPAQTDCVGDWNKLFGFSYGMHQSNSIRMVWKAIPKGLIRIGWYNYSNGIVSSKGFTNVRAGEYYRMKIEYRPADKVIYFSVEQTLVMAAYAIPPSMGYTLKPYFGGNCTAPATMKIELK